MVKWRKYRNYILLKTILKCLNASIHIIIMQLANLTKKTASSYDCLSKPQFFN